MKRTIRREANIDCNVNTCGKCDFLYRSTVSPHCDYFDLPVRFQGSMTISYIRLPECRNAEVKETTP